MRYKSWHADGNSAAKPVLMCDGSQFLCVNRTSIHYPRQCGCLETLPLWVYRLYSRNRLSVEWSNLLSNTLMTTRDTEVVLKIVIGRVRYRAQKRRQPNTYGREARATRMKRSRHPFFGCRSDSTIWMNKNPLERNFAFFRRSGASRQPALYDSGQFLVVDFFQNSLRSGGFVIYFW